MFQNRKSPSKKHKQLIQAGRLKAQELGLVVPDYEAFGPVRSWIRPRLRMSSRRSGASSSRRWSVSATFDGFLGRRWMASAVRVRRHPVQSAGRSSVLVSGRCRSGRAGDRGSVAVPGGMPARPMVYTGLQPTDERVRILGVLQSGRHHRGRIRRMARHGGAHTVRRGGSAWVVERDFSPLTAMRIGVYGSDHDGWGKPWQRQSGSYLDVDQMLYLSGTKRWSSGPWAENAYAVQCANTSERARILAELKKLGVTQIGGARGGHLRGRQSGGSGEEGTRRFRPRRSRSRLRRRVAVGEADQ